MIGKNIRQIRKERQITQQQLCSKLNIKQCTLSQYETNQRDIPTDTIYNLCKILEVTPNDLFDFHDFDLDEIRKEKQQSKYNQSFTISGGKVDIRQE